MSYLHGLRADSVNEKGKVKPGIGAQTFNFYVQAIKQFCRWMVKERRASESPVAHLEGLNVKTDRRRRRRALSIDEVHRLLAAAHDGPQRGGMSGPERALLYRVALETGLRANELRSLTRASFDLNGAPPTVTVEAAYSKHRREDVLPLRPDMAAVLRTCLARKVSTASAFNMPKGRRPVIEAFRGDLADAGVPYRYSSDLVADFHALRHTFITTLVLGGVHPKTAQTLARHSTITLTMDRYTHTIHGDLSTALSCLPDLSESRPEKLAATGTLDARPDESVLALCLAQQGRFQGTGGDSSGLNDLNDGIPENNANACKSGEKAAECGSKQTAGRVSEWPKDPVLKTGERESVPWVRIPPLPFSTGC